MLFGPSVATLTTAYHLDPFLRPPARPLVYCRREWKDTGYQCVIHVLGTGLRCHRSHHERPPTSCQLFFSMSMYRIPRALYHSQVTAHHLSRATYHTPPTTPPLSFTTCLLPHHPLLFIYHIPTKPILQLPATTHHLPRTTYTIHPLSHVSYSLSQST